ncbi:hypothetical protein [Leptospira paudalimensis]|uniref:Uncharacterized protein n=1 Tax=Leptospira paudalimensis TaxID=2950024 RepID=A0ABT3MBS0_9LEPT|nr:hypothetical protein [Leptospira paudalimensis]MCW7505839.1 hypothetical protein [Leptospira paudalimensis]
MKVLVFLLIISTSIFAEEKLELSELIKIVEKTNKSFINTIIASDRDELLKSVNYYTKEGDFKKLLKEPDRLESIDKWGDRRRWFVSKWQGKEPAIYVSAS